MRFVSLASGSSGNCSYIGTDSSHILIDAGISCKRIDDSLKTLDIRPEELQGIFITHEHSDHVCGLRVFTKKHPVPVFATQGTIDAIRRADKKGELDYSLFQAVSADCRTEVGDLRITPFTNSHDAAEPVGYRVDSEKYSVGIATDLGVYSHYTINHLLRADALLLEANHDVRMLEAGPYPFALKRRILGNKGHLSNEAAGHLLDELLHDGIRHIYLGHISKENNFPELAFETVCQEIDASQSCYRAKDFPISVAKRDSMSEVIYLGE